MSRERRGGLLLPVLLLLLLYLLGVPPFVVGLIVAWYAILLYSENMGGLDRINATRVLGIILMLRTNRGKRVLDAISKNRAFWRGYGEFSIWLCFFVMLFVILMLTISAISVILNPPPPEQVLPASDLLLIPGVTSFVPFWWPALALIVALVIHEYSHGIQARAHGMRLRSFGLLLVGPVPIGAFAEPEEEEMDRAPKRDRMRLFAAGPSINIIATYVVLILLSAIASGMIAHNEGVHSRGIVVGGPAEGANLMPYETITHINGVGVPGYSEFTNEMGRLSAGDQATFTVLSLPDFGSERDEREMTVTLGDRYEYYLAGCDGDVTCIEEKNDLLDLLGIEPGDAFLGVSDLRSGTAAMDGYSYIVDGDYPPMATSLLVVIQPLLMLYEPIENSGQTMILEERAMLVAGSGFVASTLGTEGTLMLFDFLFWLVWINFLLGFANLIPMIPFDGGHLVRDGVHSTLRRLRKGMHPMKIEQMADRMSSMSSLFILILLLIPVIIPRLV